MFWLPPTSRRAALTLSSCRPSSITMYRRNRRRIFIASAEQAVRGWAVWRSASVAVMSWRASAISKRRSARLSLSFNANGRWRICNRQSPSPEDRIPAIKAAGMTAARRCRPRTARQKPLTSRAARGRASLLHRRMLPKHPSNRKNPMSERM